MRITFISMKCERTSTMLRISKIVSSSSTCLMPQTKMSMSGV